MKSLTKYAVLCSLLAFAGMCFAQPAANPQSAPAAAQPKQADTEAIPPAAPNALFPSVVARVNGTSIPGTELEQLVRGELANIGNPKWADLREDYRGQLVLNILDSLISSKLLYQKATASGVKATDAEVQAEMQKVASNFKSDADLNLALASQNLDRATLEKNLTQNLVISKFVDENVNKKIEVTQEELGKYYSTHVTEFQHPDIVRTSHILIQPAGDTPEQDSLAKQRAEALLARINKGEDFAKLARENSMDASASQGGDIGFTTKDSLAPEYGEAAFLLPVGGIKLIKTQFGYHVIKVTDKKKEGLSTLEEVKDQLTQFMKNQKAQAELTKLVDQLRNEAKVDILIPAGQPLK